MATSPTSNSTGLRLPTRSEMTPQPILPAIPPIWKTARNAPAATTERWTSSCREGQVRGRGPLDAHEDERVTGRGEEAGIPNHRADRYARRGRLAGGALTRVSREFPVEDGEAQDGEESDTGGQPEGDLPAEPHRHGRQDEGGHEATDRHPRLPHPHGAAPLRAGEPGGDRLRPSRRRGRGPQARQEEEDQEPDERAKPRRPQAQERHGRHPHRDELPLPVAVDQETDGQHSEEHPAPDRRGENAYLGSGKVEVPGEDRSEGRRGLLQDRDPHLDQGREQEDDPTVRGRAEGPHLRIPKSLPTHASPRPSRGPVRALPGWRRCVRQPQGWASWRTPRSAW